MKFLVVVLIFAAIAVPAQAQGGCDDGVRAQLVEQAQRFTGSLLAFSSAECVARAHPENVGSYLITTTNGEQMLEIYFEYYKRELGVLAAVVRNNRLCADNPRYRVYCLTAWLNKRFMKKGHAEHKAGYVILFSGDPNETMRIFGDSLQKAIRKR